jgi:catechol 2,3-dioxygenase-like lactoylglutathione lyase family enzyme
MLAPARCVPLREDPPRHRDLERGGAVVSASFTTDHMAFVTGDTARTHDFYTRVMGWPLVWAQRGKEPDGREYFITAFGADGWVLEFEEVEGRACPPPQAPAFPHLGLDVGTREEYLRWKERLESCGVEYLEMGESDCYFTDPNGLTFQVLVKVQPQGTREEREANAHELLTRWLADREQRPLTTT